MPNNYKRQLTKTLTNAKTEIEKTKLNLKTRQFENQKQSKPKRKACRSHC
jgi:hypothetical protein